MKKNLIVIILSSFLLLISYSAFAGGVDHYTRLIIHSDGADGNTSFADSSFNPHPISVYGDVRHSTDQARFGGSAVYFDGDGDYLESPNNIDWCFDDGDFTIDLWINPAYLPFYIMEFGEDPTGENSSYNSVPWLVVADTDHIQFTAGTEDSGYIVYTAPTTIPSWAWTHVAVVRSGNTLMIFVNGISVLSAPMDFPIRCNAHKSLKIGKCVIGETPLYASGYMEEIRISKGIARWTEGFTPPTEPYKMDALADVSLRYSDNTTIMDFRLGTSEEATWKNWISIGTSIIPLYSATLPVIDPPVSFSLHMPIISGLGTVGILSKLSTPDDGITSTDWDTGFTGPKEEGAQIPEKKEMSTPFKKFFKNIPLIWNKYEGNPVLLDVGAPGTVIKDGDLYKMWYTTKPLTEGPIYNNGYTIIGYATSPDGIHWTDHGPQITNTQMRHYSNWHPWLYSPFVIKTGKTYKMWYFEDPKGWSGLHDQWVHYARSDDGIHWTRRYKVTQLNRGIDFQDVHLIKTSEYYELWYGVKGSASRIKYAISMDGKNWTTTSPSDPVFEDGEHYGFWYQDSGVMRYIRFMKSNNLLNWIDQATVLTGGQPGAWDHQSVTSPAVILDGDMYKMWYSVYDGEHYGVGYATAPVIDLLNNE